MRKLHKFYRPVIIKECLPHFCYKVQDCTSGRMLPFKIHASRIKPLTHGKGLTGLEQATSTSEQLATTANVPDSTAPTPPAQRRGGQKRAPRTRGPARQQSQRTATSQTGQQSKLQATTAQQPTWHSVQGIEARRRRPDGSLLYKVRWSSDNSTSWLPAADISSDVVRRYNATIRRRRRRQ